jgi:hypothetical protein
MKRGDWTGGVISSTEVVEVSKSLYKKMGFEGDNENKLSSSTVTHQV